MGYKNIVYLGFVLVFFIGGVNGQQLTASITGFIKDSKTKIEIEGAFVHSSSKKSNAIADEKGEFLLSTEQFTFQDDSIYFDALGYKTFAIATKDFKNGSIVLLDPVAFVLPDVVVYHFDWLQFLKKMGNKIKEAKIPFESDLHKTINVAINGKDSKKISVHALSHTEGITGEVYTSYLRGLNFWYVADKYDIEDTIGFIDCNSSGKPMLFTEFDWGEFQWLFKSYNSKSDELFADYELDKITVFENDSIYLVNYTPKPNSEKIIQSLNTFSRRGIHTYFSMQKKLYIRKKDLQLLRIDFNQTDLSIPETFKKNISNISELSGSVSFQYFNGVPHPSYIYANYKYTDINDNKIERNDRLYFSNIKQENLSEEALKKKYQIVRIYRSYPIRSVQFLNYIKLGAFDFAPIIK